MTIELKQNKIIYVKNEYTIFDATQKSTRFLPDISWKFGCFEFGRINGVNTTVCPENETSLENIFFSFAKEELKLRERDANFTYSIPYLILNNETGILLNLTSYNQINGIAMNLSSYEEKIFKQARVKLLSLFNSSELEVTDEFYVYYPTVYDTSYCIRFPIKRFSNLMINVTMLNSISNYSFGRSEFIIENHSTGNSAIAEIKPYPCCDITGITLQTAEVCSI
jgi:hypothetical protein